MALVRTFAQLRWHSGRKPLYTDLHTPSNADIRGGSVQLREGWTRAAPMDVPAYHLHIFPQESGPCEKLAGHLVLVRSWRVISTCNCNRRAIRFCHRSSSMGDTAKCLLRASKRICKPILRYHVCVGCQPLALFPAGRVNVSQDAAII